MSNRANVAIIIALVASIQAMTLVIAQPADSRGGGHGGGGHGGGGYGGGGHAYGHGGGYGGGGYRGGGYGGYRGGGYGGYGGWGGGYGGYGGDYLNYGYPSYYIPAYNNYDYRDYGPYPYYGRYVGVGAGVGRLMGSTHGHVYE